MGSDFPFKFRSVLTPSCESCLLHPPHVGQYCSPPYAPFFASIRSSPFPVTRLILVPFVYFFFIGRLMSSGYNSASLNKITLMVDLSSNQTTIKGRSGQPYWCDAWHAGFINNTCTTPRTWWYLSSPPTPHVIETNSWTWIASRHPFILFGLFLILFLFSCNGGGVPTSSF